MITCKISIVFNLKRKNILAQLFVAARMTRPRSGVFDFRADKAYFQNRSFSQTFNPFQTSKKS